MIPSKEQIDRLSANENITFTGYPGGLYDEKNKISIIRQGITATPIWNNFKGEEVFLVDAGVFPGSGGSPVFIYNQGWIHSRTILHFLTDFATEGVQSPRLNCNWHCQICQKIL